MSSAIPQAAFAGLTFFPVPTFSDPQIVFGADSKCYFNRRELPEIPKQYADHAQRLMFNGGELPNFDPRVDKNLAHRATRALLCSFEPAHEAKIATVGYAFWVWSTSAAIDAALAAPVTA